MRVMVMVKGNEESEVGVLPSPEEFEEMGRFNEELVKAGMLLAADGLQPSSKGVRIAYSGKDRTVIDGPFTEAKELVAGFWLWQVRSKDEAIEWAKRIPFQGGEVEIRPIYEAEDLAEALPPEILEQEQHLRAQVEAQQ
ncbi:MAG TPA: YciI family protein [Chloroflexota bacterium]|nr:YciI family protein [Chloroflexota bacterium]